MSLRSWMRQRVRAWRLSRAARHLKGDPLREFVYLDEVSVFSLISSRIGAVATEFTDTQSNSLKAEISSATSASGGLVKSEIRSGAEATRSSGTQVLRKATVQGTFRELYGHIKNDFVLRLPAPELPDIRKGQAARVLAAAVAAGEATPVADLRRGKLIELEVELDAEDIFQVASLMDTFLELFQEMPDALAPDLRAGLGDAVAMNAMMSKLLVGLVPLRGRAFAHLVVSTADGEWVVDRRLLDQLPGVQARDLDIVAMAEAPLFWKDLRRVLFSQSRYTMLCRIGRDGLQDDWNPVKLADVVRRFLPDVADQLGSAQRGIIESINGPSAPAILHQSEDHRLRQALLLYADALATHHGVQWQLKDVEAAAVAAIGPAVEEQRPAFAAVADLFDFDTGVSTDQVVRAELRHAAAVAGSLAPLVSPVPAAPIEPSSSRVLDTEVVAIYW